MKLRQLTLALSMVGATSVGLVGCGGDSHTYDSNDAALAEAALEKAVDDLRVGLTDAARTGTVVTVVDGYATGCKVSSGSRLATAVSTTIGQYLFLGDPTAALSATGCTDAHSGAALPPMSAPLPSSTGGLDTSVVSPVTTMVQEFVTAGQTISAAENTAAAVLGIGSATLYNDPVATSDIALQRAASKVVSIAKVAVNAASGAGSTISNPVRRMAASIAALGDPLLGDLGDAAEDVVPAAAKANVATAASAINDAVNAAANLDAISRITGAMSSATLDVSTVTNSGAVDTAASSVTLTASGITTKTVTNTDLDSTINNIISAVINGTVDINAFPDNLQDDVDAVQDAVDDVNDAGGDTDVVDDDATSASGSNNV